MKVDKIISESDRFKLDFEEKMKPYIIKKLNDDEIRVTINEDHVKKILNINYTTDNLYIKMRNIILGTDLGVSIKRKTKEFIFYKIIDGVNRESDLLKITFENRLKPYLLKELKNTCTVGFEENYLKEYLEVDYGTINIYNNLKKMLSDTNISISIKRNVIINGKKINEFVFYNNTLKKQIEEENKRNTENVRKRKKELTENIINENREIINKANSDIDNVLDNLPKVTDVNEIEVPEIEISEIDVPEFNCPNCSSKVKYHEKKCNVCDEELSWK